MKLDRETGLPLIGVPEYPVPLPRLENLGALRTFQTMMKIQELRASCGVESPPLRFRRPVAFKGPE